MSSKMSRLALLFGLFYFLQAALADNGAQQSVNAALERTRHPVRYVHNIGRGPRLEDVLFDYPISGHYRYLPD